MRRQCDTKFCYQNARVHILLRKFPHSTEVELKSFCCRCANSAHRVYWTMWSDGSRKKAELELLKLKI